jgi:hypothetical protein
MSTAGATRCMQNTIGIMVHVPVYMLGQWQQCIGISNSLGARAMQYTRA